MKKKSQHNNDRFESIKHTDSFGLDAWYDHEFQAVLSAPEWRIYMGIMGNAKRASEHNTARICDYFTDPGKIVWRYIIY